MPKNNSTTRAPVFTTADDGAPIVSVPLANRGHAVLDADDFLRLKAAGVTDQWTLNEASRRGPAYVRCGMPRKEVSGGLATVARLLMCPARRQCVRYHDGDRTNLRRANLYLSGELAGHAKDREARIMEARTLHG